MAACGEHESARMLLEDAVDRFERSGGVYNAARARLELATSLAALGREPTVSDAATAEASLNELGALPEAATAVRLRDLCGPGHRAEPLPVRPREREVLSLLATGLTNREIAELLVVSEHTVHRHVTNLLRKLGVASRTAAAAHAELPTIGGCQGLRPEHQAQARRIHERRAAQSSTTRATPERLSSASVASISSTVARSI